MKNARTIAAVLAILVLAPALVFTYFGSWGQILSNPDVPLLPYFVLALVFLTAGKG